MYDTPNITCKECLELLKEYTTNRTLLARKKFEIRLHIARCASCDTAYREMRRKMWGDK